MTVNSVHPGFVRTGFGINNGGATAFGLKVLGFLFGKSPPQGAVTPLRVACDPGLERISGEDFSRGHVVTGSATSRDLSLARKLYERCQPLTGAPDVPLPEPLREARS